MTPLNDLYVITGATGNIGSKVANELLTQGKKVRVVGRSAEKLKQFADKGAESFVGDVENAEQMTAALRGAKAVFAMIPPNYQAPNMRAYQNNIADSLIQAISKSGVPHVVFLSSFGAHLPEKTGPILGLYDTEKKFAKLSNVNVLFLRPAYFMENLLMNVGLIKSMNIAGSPLRPDVRTPMIATKDIANVVVEELLSHNFYGISSRELLGPRDVTLKEVTKALGRAINKPDLPYVQFPYEEAQKAMVQMGLSEDAANQMVELQKGINEGILKPVEPRGPRNTTPTSIDEFATTVFASVFKSS